MWAQYTVYVPLVAGNPSSDPRLVAQFGRWARVASGSVVATGVTVYIGWVLDIPALQHLYPGLASMKPNTALALAVLGLALWFSIERPSKRVVRILAIATSAIAAATLIEYVFGLDLGIDEVLHSVPGTINARGRMSSATAGTLLLLGVAMCWLESSWTQWVILIVALFAHLALLGYLYDVRDLYAIGPYNSVALHTAVSIYLLAIGTLLARPQRGLIRLVVSDSPGGVLARRLLPAAIVLPAVLALLRKWGEARGLYGTGFGRAMLVASNSVIFVGLTWWTAAAILRSDRLRRVAEQAVRESEAYLSITLDSIGDAVIATDERGRIVRMNAVAERLTGWPCTDARARSLSDVFRIVNEDTGMQVENPADRVLREGVVVGMANHTALIARDGTTRAIADCAAPIRDAQGATRGVVLVFQDQTEARSAVRRVHDSKARKAAILESAMDAIVSIDAAGTIVEFNPAAEAMFGRTRGDALGIPFADSIDPADQLSAYPNVLASQLTREPVTGTRAELTALRANGIAFPVEVSITRVARSDPPMLTMFLRDVTEPKRARAELVRSNDRMRALTGVSDALASVATTYQTLLDKTARMIADLVGDGCVVMLFSEDGERIVNAANAHRDPAIEQDYRSYLTGVEVSRVADWSIAAKVARTGQPWWGDISPSAMVDQADRALRQVVARLSVHSVAVAPIRARDVVIGTLSLLRSQPGHSYTDEDVTLLQDVADRAGLAIENARLYAQLEQRVRERTVELQAANEGLEAFSYSVAHDLRAPLRAMSGFSVVLLEDYADQLGAEGQRYATRIHDAGKHMGQLIEGILHLSSISRTKLRRARVDISDLARVALARLHATEPERHVEIVVEPDLVAHADPRLLEVALTNLLGNAWKFTSKRERARIEFAACADNQTTTYFIRDNGAGFESARAEKLFGAFQRFHAAQDFEGTGIGLATVQRIIRSHDGRIWADSEVDKGATFYFTLDAAGRAGAQPHL